MSEQPQPPQHSLAHKLERLFKTLHPAGRGEYTLQEVIDGIRAQGGPTLSIAYLWQLRAGVRDNPRKEHLEALAKFFQVNPSYFFDGEVADRVESQLDLIAAMRDAEVQEIALSASALTPEGRRAIAAMIEQVRQLQNEPTKRS